MESDARSGRPSTSRNDELIVQVRTLVMQDHRVTVRELVEEVGISTGSVHSILTDDLAMRKVSAKFVPKLLTMEEKQLRLEVSQDILDYANSDPNSWTSWSLVMSRGFTGTTRKPRRSRHSGNIQHPRGQKMARQVRSNVKVMLTIFFDFPWGGASRVRTTRPKH